MALTLKAISEQLGGVVHGDDTIEVDKVATLVSAKAGNISFLTNKKYREQLVQSQASAVLIHASELAYCQEHANAVPIVLDNPYLSYARLAQLMDTTPKQPQGIHPSAVVEAGATVAPSASIGANAVVSNGAVIGENAVIGANCFIGENSSIGNNTRLWANVSIYHDVSIGSDCLFQSGAVIGSDGFGYAPDGRQWVKIPQLGGVVIGDRVEVGANTAIDRGALDNTVISDGVIIDNLCHLAHNISIGENSALAGGSMIAGSSTVGANCAMGGKAGISGHLTVADNVVMTATAMVLKDIKEPGSYSSGIASMPSQDWRKLNVRLKQLDDMYLNLKKAEKAIAHLSEKLSEKND